MVNNRCVVGILTILKNLEVFSGFCNKSGVKTQFSLQSILLCADVVSSEATVERYDTVIRL